LPIRAGKRKFSDVKTVAQKTLTDEEWLRDIFEYERTHEIAFASPRALLEARMIAEMDKARLRGRSKPHKSQTTNEADGDATNNGLHSGAAKARRPHRRAHRNGVARRRKVSAR